jgi:hypothetical protein
MPQYSITLLGTTSTLDLTGDKQKGAGWQGLTTGFHSTGWEFNAFKGRIKIQATLATDPASTDWFDVDIDGSGLGYVEFTSAFTGAKNYNFTGNFVWVRAVMLRTYNPALNLGNAGNIKRVLYNF